MLSGMEIVIGLLSILAGISFMVFLISLVFWIISVAQKDSAYAKLMGQQKRTKDIRNKFKESSNFETRMEIESDVLEIESNVLEEEYSIRKQKVQKYRLVWVVAGVLSCIFFSITAVIIKDYAVSFAGNNASAYTSSSVPTPQTQKTTFQLPDGTIVGEDDVYIGADGQYYLKPGVDPYSTVPQQPGFNYEINGGQ